MSKITDLSQLDLNKTYSYADYLTWQLEQTVELIKGKIFQMSPAPKVKHQQISFNLSLLIGNYLKGKDCKAFAAPFDVRLYNKKESEGTDEAIFTVVQPDLCIICDLDKLDENGCLGTPDLIIEILSKGNSNKEMSIKYELYEEAQVKEYWVIDPEREHLQQFILNEEGIFYLKKTYFREDTFYTHILPDFALPMEEVLEE